MGLNRDRALEIAGITCHQYYYKGKEGNPGRRPSKETKQVVNGKTSYRANMEVIEFIKGRQSNIDLRSGHRRMTHALMLAGFIINHKKVFRLMKKEQLLLSRPKRQSKKYARYRTVTPENPLEVFAMDIKLVYCGQTRRQAQILTIIDVFTRVAVYWEVGYTMKQEQVLKAWSMITEHILQPARDKGGKVHIEIRNDNGPQFSAKKLRRYFKENGLNQVFAHPYTPQENGHVESFHAILGKTLEQYGFWSLEDVQKRLEMFYDNYNNKRIHSSIANLPPNLFWQLWNQGGIERTVLSKRKVKFSLLLDYQRLSGNENLREVPCFSFSDLDGREMKPDCHQVSSEEKVDEPQWPITLKKQPSVQRSPSVVPC